MKTMSLTNLIYEMLVEAAKKRRLKPIDLLSQLITQEYNRK